MNINEILKVKISAMKTGDSVDSYEVVWDRRRNTDKVEKMTTEHIYDITQELGRLAIIMDLDTPLGVCEFLKWTCSSVFYTMWVNSGAFAQYIADKPLINLLKKLRDRLITITKWWERYGDEIYIKCINEPEDKTLPSASDRCELENNYKVASEWLEIIGYANISEPDKPEGIKSMTHTLPEQYKWLASHAKLGYFCCKSFEQPRPITALEQFFGLKNLAASITQASYEPKRGDVKKWRAELDRKIFFD